MGVCSQLPSNKVRITSNRTVVVSASMQSKPVGWAMYSSTLYLVFKLLTVDPWLMTYCWHHGLGGCEHSVHGVGGVCEHNLIVLLRHYILLP